MKHQIFFSGRILSCLMGLLLVTPISNAFAALVVTGPGKVLMIDGTDSNVTVNITAIDGTFPIGKYDFGFASGSGYTSITSAIGSYTFTGGSVVDFALRDRGLDLAFGTTDDVIYSISNPLDYADQIYSIPIAASNSRNPIVTSPYYRTLVLAWDLNRDGVTDTGFDIGVSTPLLTKDGVAPAPVPLPAAVWLFGSGLLSLFGVARRKRA